MKRLILISVLLSLPALADGAAVAPTAAPAWLQQLLSETIAVLVPLVASALFALLVAGARWLAAKAKGTRFEHAVSVVEEAVEGAVNRIKVKLLAKFAEATADGSDGGKTVTAAERAAILAEGVAALKAEIGPGVLAVLKGSFGAGLDSWLTAKIDGAINPPSTAVGTNPSSP